MSLLLLLLLIEANDVFAGTGINITTKGRKHLGVALGQRSYVEEYVGSKVKEWISEVTLLAEFASLLCSLYIRAEA